MTNIIAFPPVGTVQLAWFVQQPVQRSRRLFSGARSVSAFQPARVRASVTISALANGRSGAGYSDALWRQLDGGVNLVALLSPPANWHLDAQREWGWGAPGGFRGLGTQPVSWTSGGAPLSWTEGGDPLAWFSGSLAQATPGSDSIGPIITVTGLPPSQLVVRPSEIVRSYPPGNLAGVAARAVTEARSNAEGVAVIRLTAALPAGTVSLGGAERRVFEVTNEPAAQQPVGQNWTIQWDFLEVLPDEITDPVEVNPW